MDHSADPRDAVLRKLLVYWSGSRVVCEGRRLLVDVLTGDQDDSYMQAAAALWDNNSRTSSATGASSLKMRFPTASTCSMTLFLPQEYANYHVMYRGLNVMLEYGVGFDLA